jgi:hypothetical protein
MSFTINPQHKQQIIYVGNEQTPVFVVDELLLDLSATIAEARQAHYVQQPSIGSYYPGKRAPVGSDYGMTVLQFAAQAFYHFFKVPRSLTLYPQDGSYSQINVVERDMHLLQCIPHYDNTNTYGFAILHYLNPGNFGGTGFFRHVPSGYENISEQRKPAYLQSAQAHIDQYGNPQQAYIRQSNDHYELIYEIEYRPNRLLLYPSTVLHSALIKNPQSEIQDDVNVGRLSANFFLEFKPE